MASIITVLQIITAILLIITVLLQSKGTGLGSTFGGEGGFYRSRRGTEKILLWSTVVLAAVFLITSVLNVAL